MDKQKLKELAECNASDLAAAIEAEDWDIHMQFSPLRQSILNWYEFKRDASLLEIHAEYGALTGLFCQRCAMVTSIAATADEEEILLKRYGKKENFHIIKGNLPEVFQEMDEQYDYIVAFGSIESADNPAAAISQWMQQLKPGGKLLLTAENRYGLKYFCGAKDPYTFIPFDGVNGYLGVLDGSGECLSRKELVTAIERAGVYKYQFYYPVPDSRMPQMIFSDRYMKGTNAAERLVDYHYEDESMVGVEHRIFSEMIDSGALPFMANSFLVELMNEEELTGKGRFVKEGKLDGKGKLVNEESLSDIIYAVITTDRGRERGTATTIRSTGVVKKRPLWPEGEANIQKLHEYTEELLQRGIPIVPTKIERDSCGLLLSMPYLDEEGLSTVMKRLAVEDHEKFVRIFDEIYGYILAASDGAEGEVSEREEPEREVSEREALKKGGKLLKKAYLDLAPCNCFYIKEKGKLLFYDQEFVLENCPAQFAMFRTLKYCYASAMEMDREVPLKRMYKRYGIDKRMIADFEKKEEEFIREVRSTDHYRRIFQWATPDYVKICRRMREMAALTAPKEEAKPYRIGYVPGVFDLFHTGHLQLLERCKARCEYLIVGVLTDELVEYYKGTKPVISYEDRARVIGALSVVDEVIPVDFSNTDKLDAWNQLHYDCHFSGDDHLKHWDDVWEELKKRGSMMEFFPYTQGISSTQIREKLK